MDAKLQELTKRLREAIRNYYSATAEGNEHLARMHKEYLALCSTPSNLTLLLDTLEAQDGAVEKLAMRDKLMHGKFDFVPSPDDPKKCGCAYCTADNEALADCCGSYEMELFLPGGWKDRAASAEAKVEAQERTITDLSAQAESLAASLLRAETEIVNLKEKA